MYKTEFMPSLIGNTYVWCVVDEENGNRVCECVNVFAAEVIMRALNKDADVYKSFLEDKTNIGG